MVAPGAHGTMVTGSFAYASRFTIGHLTQIDYSGVAKEVLRLFKGKNIDRASLYSPDRRPLPRCHAKTRRDLREKILGWLENAKKQESGIFWIEGPAGVGKSAIAQTIGEDSRRISQLGAVFFVSHQDDPRSIIPTLAYQLQLFYPEYKQIIVQQLEKDPTILDKEIDDQFAELITKPFAILLEQGCFSARNALLIILDGLGECRNETEQCQVIKLIHNYTQQNSGLPLLWMLTTRPERQFSSLISTISCIRDRLSVDDDRAKEDVRHMLEAGFGDIRERYADMLGMGEEETWPSEKQLGEITEAAGGLFALASAALRFVDDDEVKSPDTQLEKFLEYMRCPLPTVQTNPLHPLDALYGRILSAINLEIFNTTTRILSFYALYPEANLSARDVANFLCIRRGRFYAALDPLRSVIVVPSAKEAHDRGIRFYHSSFVSYLRQPERSGRYSLRENRARCDIAIHCIRWYNYWLQHHCKLEAEDGTTTCHSSSLPRAEWPGSHKGYPDDPYPFHPRLETFAQSWCWDTCRRVDTQDLPTVIKELRQFNFCHLGKFHADTRQCREMIKWIVNLDDQNEGLVRLAPNSKTDHQLFQKCYPKFAKDPEAVKGTEDRYCFISLHHHDDGPQDIIDDTGERFKPQKYSGLVMKNGLAWSLNIITNFEQANPLRDGLRYFIAAKQLPGHWGRGRGPGE